jgi:CBS domain containing-hemolysin-like protein
MPATLTRSLRTDLNHAISAIQNEWSPRERARRQRLADLRQRRLARMLTPRPNVEAYDCRCDMADEFPTEDRNGHSAGRSHCFVLVEE